jgi:ketosteroid isomerase-like protein
MRAGARELTLVCSGMSPELQQRSRFARASRGAKEATVSEAKKVLEQAVERWNATDRAGWAALYTDDVVYEAPGGARISGLPDLKEKYFDALVAAAPDRRSRDVILFAEGDHVVEQARYRDAHGYLAQPGRC